jgi:CheY-like chemotaxis protein
MLDPQIALHMAMVINELGTNSCKYAGWVTANWTVGGGQLRLSWIERGGPAVAAPSRRGFGSVFIEQSVKSHQGKAHLLSEPEGISWTITLPLDRSTTDSASSILPKQMDGALIRKVSSNYRAAIIQGKRVLVVEDEPLVAMDLVGILKNASAKPAGPVGTAAGALQLIESETFDAALVDANLGGMPVDEIAHALVRRNVPFAFVTGYDRASLPPHFQNIAMLSKPFSAPSLLEIVNKILSQES